MLHIFTLNRSASAYRKKIITTSTRSQRTQTYTTRSITGIDKEQAEREVDEYLKDKDAYIAKARAEEARQAKKK